MAYTEIARSLGAHIRDIDPRACGGKESITPGHRARVTTGLPQFTFRDNEVTTLCLTSHIYSLLGEQGRGSIGKTGSKTVFIKVKVTLGAYAEAAQGHGAHLRDFGP